MRRHEGGKLIELDGDEVMWRWDHRIRSTINDDGPTAQAAPLPWEEREKIPS